MTTRRCFLILFFFALVGLSACFSPMKKAPLCFLVAPGTAAIVSRRTVLLATIDDDEDSKSEKKKKKKKIDLSAVRREELTDDGDYTGSTDWDAEWKKVMKNENQPMERPGRDFYKSEAEISAIKAANRAAEEAAKVARTLPSLPSFDTLKGDWRFWIGIIAVISVGASLLNGMAYSSMTTAAPPLDSYYI